MRQMIGNNYGAYSFNPTLGTITITGIDENLVLENFFYITNMTKKVVLFTATSNTKSATAVIDNVISLDYDTSAMDFDDRLQILVDVPNKDTELLKTLSRIARLLEASGNIDPATLSQKVAVVNTAAVTVSSGTITTLTNLTNRITANVDQINGTDPRFLLEDQTVAAFNLAIRSRYTFT